MKSYTITVNGQAYDVQVEEKGGSSVASAPVAAAPAAPAPKAAPAQEVAADAEKITSPMPGTVLDIKVNAGDSVKRGDTLIVLEAMKMENNIVAPRDAIVASVNVAKGDSVESGSTLVAIK